jgi:hypothetical protein
MVIIYRKMKRVLKIVGVVFFALILALALLGLAWPDHVGIPAGVAGQMVSIENFL